MVVAATTDRRSGEPLTVGGLRTIRRGISLAQRWGLPILTLGAPWAPSSPSKVSSPASLGRSPASCSTSCLLAPRRSRCSRRGDGGSRTALLATDRIVAGSHTWVAPWPEGAAAIRHAGPHDPAQIAWDQRIGVHALAELGFIDRVVRESDPGWVSAAADAVAASLREVIAGQDPRRRFERFDAWAT